MKFVRPGGENILLVNVEGTVYAVGNYCTHSKCYLHNGKLEGRIVTCPCHSAKFDVVTGEVKAPPAKKALGTYAVKVEDDGILVAV
jgi:nitrite reductase/ring-hydroxylating ferredoxin subunit